ncbi:hypothetical protein [Sphingosinicella rhizophila]|uniref:Uncharacterized protein n=1 Tax=Sphingosinicella rhizophila TaxID=3050082 RepID=A0ABU3Q7D8_9SPHN|nr:hypothetical protein [Sphingosinicella sp. GR2756]MDT9599309.1 hypothetical protein [Sphingosinicella sp. GR2756]
MQDLVRGGPGRSSAELIWGLDFTGGDISEIERLALPGEDAGLFR